MSKYPLTYLALAGAVFGLLFGVKSNDIIGCVESSSIIFAVVGGLCWWVLKTLLAKDGPVTTSEPNQSGKTVLHHKVEQSDDHLGFLENSKSGSVGDMMK